MFKRSCVVCMFHKIRNSNLSVKDFFLFHDKKLQFSTFVVDGGLFVFETLISCVFLLFYLMMRLLLPLLKRLQPFTILVYTKITS